MSNLRFRCLVDSDFCDIAPFEPYIEKGSLDMGLALIAFDESELDTIKNLLKEAQLEGSDGYLYTLSQASVYKGYKQDKIEMRGDRAEMSDFPLYLNTVAGGLDRRDQTIGGFSFVVKIYAVPVVEIIG